MNANHDEGDKLYHVSFDADEEYNLIAQKQLVHALANAGAPKKQLERLGLQQYKDRL